MASVTAGDSAGTKYRSYVLRLWHAETLGQGWRASLEDPRTGKQIGFAGLEQLFAYLMELVEQATKGKGDTSA